MRRSNATWATLFIIAAALAAALVMCGSAEASAAIRDFRDIPGITAEEIAAIEALREERGSLTYGMLMTTETFIGDDGRVGGYSALFCDWMSELFGIRFVPRIYDWDELMRRFEDGTVDFTGELTSTPERLEKYIMSDTFTERAIKAFRLRDSEKLSEIARVRTVRGVFLRGTTTIDAVLSSSNQEIAPILVDTEEAAMVKLRTREADAFFAEEHGAAILPDDIMGEDVFPVVYSPISLATTRKELEPIITVFDKYLKNGAFAHLIDLYNRGNDDYLRHRLRSRLTNEEKAYIAAHASDETAVALAAESDNYPCSFYNKQENEWQGIAIDVLAQISDLSGLKFRVVNAPDAPWPQVFGLLKSGGAAMVTELIYSQERKGRYLWANEPYAKDYYALLSLADHEDININQILYSRVGLIAGTGYADVFRDWFPHHSNTVEYKSSLEGFAGLQKGEVDLLMASRNILLSATNYHEMPGFKANIVFDRTYESKFGFGSGEEILCSIVGKAQRLADTRMTTERWARKVFDYRGKLARAQVPYLVGVLALLICVLVLVLTILIRDRQMKKDLEATVHERTAELEVQTAAARDASRAKGDFLSRMSHEIRTPLNAIIGMAQIAQRTAAEDSPRTLAAINEMITASNHLLEILNNVLDISKIESGNFNLASDPFEIGEAVRDVENIIAQRCREKGIAFTVDVRTPPGAAIVGDRLRLKQVLINLLGNAVKFTPEGGAVSLGVDPVEESADRAALRFTVRDSGIGMTGEQLARIFTPFVQAESSIASRFGGTGLGLAISQNLVMQMGGKITAESEPGRGTTFAFTVAFPKAEGTPPRGESAPEGQERNAALDLSGRRILLAEDIDINRMIIAELLGDTKVEIDEATDGEEAAEAFEKSPAFHYDLIFMDIHMPVMDGYEAARRIRAMDRPDAKSVPIIAMTADAYKEDIDKAFESGMNGHIPKPIDIEAVKRLLSEKIGG